MNLIVNRKACNFRQLKDTLQISLLAIIMMNSVAAQNYVVPNKPYRLTDPKPGYLTINEINLGTGLAVTNVPFAKIYSGFTSTHGYQLDKNFYAGAGTGILFYNGGPMLPVYVDIRYHTHHHFSLSNPVGIICNGRGKSDLTFVPFAYIDGGILFHLSGDDTGRKRFINTGLGLNYLISNNLTADFSAGLFSQFETLRDSFIRFRLGISYKFKRH